MATLCVKQLTGVLPVVVQLRAADEAEVAAMFQTPLEAVHTSILRSLHSFEVWVGPDLCAWWGYSPISVLGDTAVAWMLTTPAADSHPVQIARASIRLFNQLHASYPRLLVNVDPLHEDAVRWLTWLGFQFHSTCNGYDIMISERGAAKWAH